MSQTHPYSCASWFASSEDKAHTSTMLAMSSAQSSQTHCRVNRIYPVSCEQDRRDGLDEDSATGC